jgi:hypothetical protein
MHKPAISFQVTPAQSQQLQAIIADAVARKIIKRSETLDYTMSVRAAIAQGCKIDLAKLAAFDDFNLGHDLHGIHRHIDKDDDSPTAGQLLNCFLPRSARG